MRLPPNVKQTIFCSASLLNMMGLGMMFGYPAILIPALLAETGNDVKAGPDITSWLASMPGIAGIITSITTGSLMHVYGRKPTHIIMSLVILTGWIITALSHSLIILIIGRALQCLNNGCAYLNSICIGEMSSPSIRGLLLNFKLMAVSSGVLIIHGLGYFLHWRQLAWVGTVPHFLSLIISFYRPETPEWLVSRRRFKEAEIVFFYLRGQSNESEREIRILIETEKKKQEEVERKKSFMDNLKKMRSKVLWKPVALMCCSLGIPELGGRQFFPSYSLQLAEKIVGSKTKGFIYTIILDIIILSAAGISNIFVSRFSRRTLIIVCGYMSNFFLLVSCFLMFVGKNDYDNDVLMWSLICVLVCYFLSVYGALFGTCYILLGEILPLEYRSIATVLDGILNGIVLTMVMKAMPVLTYSIDVHGMLFVFSMCMLIIITYMYFNLPETKNRTLHDIGEYFRGKSTKFKNDEVLVDGEITTLVFS